MTTKNTPLLHSLVVQQCKYTKTNLQLRDRTALDTTLNINDVFFSSL